MLTLVQVHCFHRPRGEGGTPRVLQVIVRGSAISAVKRGEGTELPGALEHRARGLGDRSIFEGGETCANSSMDCSLGHSCFLLLRRFRS